MISLEKPGSPADLVEHFGIKGMHWGVRKERETSSRKSIGPNDRIFKASRAKRRERRARGHEAEANKTQRQIDFIKSKPTTWFYAQHLRNNRVKELEKYRDRELKAAKDIRAGRLTDFQKNALIGAGVAATILATYGTYKAIDSGTVHQLLNRNTPLKKNDLLSRTMSKENILRDIVEPINPNYGELGTKMNCRRATFAYEMRRRGYDVKATNSVEGTGQAVAGLLNATNPESHLHTGIFSVSRQMKRKGSPVYNAVRTAKGLGKQEISFKPRFVATQAGNIAKVELSRVERTEEVFNAIRRHGDGARGELGLGWKSGGAHSMAWEMINGTPHIFDAQTGTMHDIASFHSLIDNIDTAGITRLDNIPLNHKFLGKWVRNVK